MKHLIATLSMMSLAACRTTLPEASDTKHIFGETRHDGKEVQPCKWDKETSINPDIDLYLAAVARTIAIANPKTFEAPFEIQNICIYIQADDKLNANAVRNLNTIFVNSGLIFAASNDAEVASTLAHELAHLTMQSDHGEDVPPEVLRSVDWPKMRDQFESESQATRDQKVPLQDECNMAQSDMHKISIELAAEWSDALAAEGARLQSIYHQLNDTNAAQYIDLQIPHINDAIDRQTFAALTPEAASQVATAFKRDRNAFLARIRKTENQLALKWEEKLNTYLIAYQKIQTLQQRLAAFQKRFDQFISGLAGTGAKYSWREQQADEVGYELYLRAGFDPSYMPWLERANMGETEYQKCLKEYVGKGVAPIRSQSAHPTDCWRIYDFLYLEARYHAKDYQTFYATSHIVTIPTLNGQLSIVKKLWRP